MAQMGFVGDVAVSTPTSSAAYGGMLSVGSPSVAAPGGIGATLTREIIMGVVVAVLAGLLIRKLK